MKKSKKILFTTLGLSLAALTSIVAFVSYKKPNKNLVEQKNNTTNNIENITQNSNSTNFENHDNHKHEIHIQDNIDTSNNEHENQLIKNQIEQFYIEEQQMVNFNLNEKLSKEKEIQEKTINELNPENLIKNLNDVIHYQSFDDIKNKLEAKLAKEINNFKEKFGDVFSIQFIDLTKNSNPSLFNKVEKFYTSEGYPVFKITTNAVFIASSQYPYGDIFEVDEFQFYLVSNIETNHKTNIELIKYQDLKIEEASITKENEQIELVIKGENLNHINQDDLYLIKKHETNLFKLNDNLIKNQDNKKEVIEIISQNETEIIAKISDSNMPEINYFVGINNQYFPNYNSSILLTDINTNYSTLVETKLVEIHQEKEQSEKLNWDMDYSIGWWSKNWDNKITVNLKGKNNNFNKWNGQNNRWPINLRIFEVQLPYVLIKRNGKNDNEVSDRNDLYADYLLIDTLKNIKEKDAKQKEELLEEVKKQVKVEYIGYFGYANSIKCSNNGNGSCCGDLNLADSSCARKYDYFDGNGYGYSLYNSFGLKTISETSREVQFEIKLPIVKNKGTGN